MALFKFRLTPGQQAPPGNTGRALAGDWIVLEADSWPTGWDDITHEAMTAEEILADTPDERIKTSSIFAIDTDKEMRSILVGIAIITQRRMVELRDTGTFTEHTIEELVAEVKGVINSGSALQ
ncbi:MAG: hypothetical protein CL480_11080 [Acidobacteria bacterium]|nr:hypothetical protein [Acidobacteriota bacterium]|tara:strand:+ start:346 stop:714 length:369 start_codon:yes stop_codon:yes gene_type:complete